MQNNDRFRPTYTAIYTTIQGELGNSQTLTATLEDQTKLVYHQSDNSFTAIDTGSTYAVLTYKGLPDTIFFVIIDLNETTSTTGVADPDLSSEGRDIQTFKLYPNPTQGTVNIAATFQNNGEVFIEFFDLLGRSVTGPVAWSHIPGENQTKIQLGLLPEGIYFCRLLIRNSVRTQSVIVRR